MKKGRRTKYPWREMQVGESFFAANRTTTSIMCDARRHHKPRCFTSRMVMHKGIVGAKVTRIA